MSHRRYGEWLSLGRGNTENEDESWEAAKIFWFWWAVGIICTVFILFSSNLLLKLVFFCCAIFSHCFGYWLSEKVEERLSEK